MSDNIVNPPRFSDPELQEKIKALQEGAALKGGGGGGTFDDMEERVRKLEGDMSYMRGRLEDMPTKDWMTTRLMWVVGAVVAILSLVQWIIESVGA